MPRKIPLPASTWISGCEGNLVAQRRCSTYPCSLNAARPWSLDASHLWFPREARDFFFVPDTNPNHKPQTINHKPQTPKELELYFFEDFGMGRAAAGVFLSKRPDATSQKRIAWLLPVRFPWVGLQGPPMESVLGYALDSPLPFPPCCCFCLFL